jgi:outer membrane autotransporter protein
LDYRVSVGYLDNKQEGHGMDWRHTVLFPERIFRFILIAALPAAALAPVSALAQLVPSITTPLPTPAPDNPISKVITPDHQRVAINNIINIIETQIINSLSRSVAGSRARPAQVRGGNDLTRRQYDSRIQGNDEVAQTEESGLDPADRGEVLSPWISAAVSWLENDKIGGAFDGELITPLVGIDRLFTPAGFLYGVSFGHERLDLDTPFGNGTYEAHGFTIAPYLGFRWRDSVLFAAGVGYSRLNYDQGREATGGRVMGSFDADRVVGFGSITGLVPQAWLPNEAFALNGTLGFTFAWEQQDAFRESDGTAVDENTSRLGQIRVGARASYFAQPAGIDTEAFLTGTFYYDVIEADRTILIGGAAPSDDRSDFVLTIGLNANFTETLSGNIEFSNTFAREDFSNHTLLAGVKYTF